MLSLQERVRHAEKSLHLKFTWPHQNLHAGINIKSGLICSSSVLRCAIEKILLKQYRLFRWFCFFTRTDLEKCSITLLAHQWILCSEWVPSEWVQTADKNITVTHTSPVHQLTSWKVEKRHVCKEQIHNYASSSEKVILSELGEKKA